MELHVLYSSANIIRADSKEQDTAYLTEMIIAYNTLVLKKKKTREIALETKP